MSTIPAHYDVADKRILASIFGDGIPSFAETRQDKTGLVHPIEFRNLRQRISDFVGPERYREPFSPCRLAVCLSPQSREGVRRNHGVSQRSEVRNYPPVQIPNARASVHEQNQRVFTVAGDFF